MKINNIELPDLDIFEADIAEKYEKEIEKVKEESKNFEGMKDSEVIRKSCNLVFDCFNNLFGPGTDKKVFGNKTNLLVCVNAFDELIDNVNEQKKKADAIANRFNQKYQNRAQRRHNNNKRR